MGLCGSKDEETTPIPIAVSAEDKKAAGPGSEPMSTRAAGPPPGKQCGFISAFFAHVLIRLLTGGPGGKGAGDLMGAQPEEDELNTLFESFMVSSSSPFHRTVWNQCDVLWA